MRKTSILIAAAVAFASVSPAAAGGLFGGTGINVSPKIGVSTGHILSGNNVGILNGNAILNGNSILSGNANGNVLGVLSKGRKKKCGRRC